ncbi:MAG: hypothetical protein FH748_01270 [Balneolaceae bacterium]|nr:hypothetical protein [Balneolaceae bacterium]
MNSHTTYFVFGPTATLRRMSSKLFKEQQPKFLYEYSPEDSSETIYVAVYEEYEKQINSSVTLTCIIESSGKHNKIVLKKTGGRMGFRGSSLSEERNIEADVVDFILDFSKRHGLTLQEEKTSAEKGEE